MLKINVVLCFFEADTALHSRISRKTVSGDRCDAAYGNDIDE